jgi:hypothetical protein
LQEIGTAAYQEAAQQRSQQSQQSQQTSGTGGAGEAKNEGDKVVDADYRVENEEKR